MEEKTREKQYQGCLDLYNKQGLTKLGLMTNYVWHNDPKRLLFVLSRYKFVAKMLSGKKNVLEIGCADAFGARIVLQGVKKLTAVDFDPIFIEDANNRMDKNWNFKCKTHDILKGPIEGNFDAVYAIDMLEHIPEKDEEQFMFNIIKSLTKDGVLIIGTPSLESQKYASPQSKEGHVNCKSYKELKELMLCFFHNVFIFSMNDEVVHTGFYNMANYLFALCCGVKDSINMKLNNQKNHKR